MKRTLIYYRTGQIDLAKKLQDNYIAHQTETDIISAEEHDDIEYAIENQYDEAVFTEDSETVVIHEMKSGYTNRYPVSDVYYQ